MSEYKEPYVSDVREDGAGSVYEDDRDRNHERVQFEKAPVPASVEKHETTMNGFKDLSPDVVELIKAQIKNERPFILIPWVCDSFPVLTPCYS